MNPRFFKALSNDPLLEFVETQLLTGHPDPIAREKREERILHALRRVLRQRLVQDPGVVRIEF